LFFEVSTIAKQQTCTLNLVKAFPSTKSEGEGEGGGVAMVWEGYVMIKAKQKHQDHKNMFFLHTVF
jgi:hypothetical protein